MTRLEIPPAELVLLYDSPAAHAVPIQRYPDGMPRIVHEDVAFAYAPSAILARLSWRADSLPTLYSALYLHDALMERDVPYIDQTRLVLPFVPGARQDRLNSTGDVLFSAKSVARDINARNFSRVVVVDPHSLAAPALIDRCKVISAAACLGGWVGANAWSCVISPDAGAQKRADEVAHALRVPVINATKERNVRTGELSSFYIPPAMDFIKSSPKPPLIVDDICDGGGTFVGLAEVMEAQDYPTPDLYVTHGIFSKGFGAIAPHFSHVLTTDSIVHEWHENPKLAPPPENLVTIKLPYERSNW